jgi:hypothetical protein
MMLRLRIKALLTVAVLATGATFVMAMPSTAMTVGPPASGYSHPPGSAVAAGVKAKDTGCAGGDLCETIPANCPRTDKCPSVQVGPVKDLGVGQFVFVRLKGFPPGDSVDINYCEDIAPLTKSAPLCDVLGTQLLPAPQYVLPIFSNGTSAISYSVLENPDTGSPPFQGEVPGTNQHGKFFCDNGPHYCSIVITDPNLGGVADLTPSPANSAAFPVTFAASTNGCPKAAFISTESDFGIETLLPSAGLISCKAATPAVALNTALDSESAVTALGDGQVQIAFTDDPEAANEKAILDAPGSHFALIPVAVTAEVVGFKATMEQSGHAYPENTFQLTPNQVAGLITNYYGFPSDSDLGKCPPPTGHCSLLETLNNVNGYVLPQDYGGYVRSDPTGVIDELFRWICTAPNVPFKVLGKSVQDPNAASITLLRGLRALGAKETKCPETDQFPPLRSPGVYWSALSDPAQQLNKLSAVVLAPNLTVLPAAGFAPMTWPESLYYGLEPVALQDAAGKFVLPSAGSIDAALVAATRNKDGSLTPNMRDTKRKGAYPLPSVVYAAVPTRFATATEAKEVKAVLSGLISVSAGPSSKIPQGFIRLPGFLAHQAANDLARDITVAAPTKPVTSTTTTTPSTQPSTTTTTRPTKTTTTTQSSSSGKGKHRTVPYPPTPSNLLAFFLGPTRSGWVLPMILAVAIGAIVLGPLLLLLARQRRRTTKAGGGSS